MIKYPHEIDRGQFAPDIANPDVKYGLPQDVRFCRRCVISNQRPNSAVEYKHTNADREGRRSTSTTRASATPAALPSASDGTIDWDDARAQSCATCATAPQQRRQL